MLWYSVVWNENVSSLTKKPFRMVVLAAPTIQRLWKHSLKSSSYFLKIRMKKRRSSPVKRCTESPNASNLINPWAIYFSNFRIVIMSRSIVGNSIWIQRSQRRPTAPARSILRPSSELPDYTARHTRVGSGNKEIVRISVGTRRRAYGMESRVARQFLVAT